MAHTTYREHGIVVPLVTPLDDEDRIDEAGLCRLIDHVLRGGVHGVFVMGTTGESVRLSLETWKRCVRRAVEHVQGRVPVYVGVITSGVREALARVELATDLGADAVVISPGYYFPLSQDEIVQFYDQIAASAVFASPSVCVSLYAYNIPQHTQTNIHPNTLRRIARTTPLAGIKDSAGSLEQIETYLALGREHGFTVFAGDESIAAALRSGAIGIIPSLANVFPGLFAELYAAALAGNWERVDSLNETVKAVNVLNGMSASSLRVIAWKKYALKLFGICGDRLTEPSLALSEAARERVVAWLKQLETGSPGLPGEPKAGG